MLTVNIFEFQRTWCGDSCVFVLQFVFNFSHSKKKQDIDPWNIKISAILPAIPYMSCIVCWYFRTYGYLLKVFPLENEKKISCIRAWFLFLKFVHMVKQFQNAIKIYETTSIQQKKTKTLLKKWVKISPFNSLTDWGKRVLLDKSRERIAIEKIVPEPV